MSGGELTGLLACVFILGWTTGALTCDRIRASLGAPKAETLTQEEWDSMKSKKLS